MYGRTYEQRFVMASYRWRILLVVPLVLSLSLCTRNDGTHVHAYTMTHYERTSSIVNRLLKLQYRNDANDVDEAMSSSPSSVQPNTVESVNSVYSNARGRSTTGSSITGSTNGVAIRQAWVDKSIRYYSTVLREERRKQLGQIPQSNVDTDAATALTTQHEFEKMAYKHYFALRKVKDGKPHHAERIYRRIIHELQQESESDDHCDHAKFAVTTLLLALHMQRGSTDAKATRSVFINFFRTVVADARQSQYNNGDTDEPHHECACSAKVLQAFALFEMKQGNELKSLEIIMHAIRYDPSLNTILTWKQFRDVQARKQERWNEKVL